MAKITLVAPGETNPGNDFIGFGGEGDILYFPHVDSCLAFVIFGPRYMVGAHLGREWLQLNIESWTGGDTSFIAEIMLAKVHAMYHRLNNLYLNNNNPKVLTIGASDWYSCDIQSKIMSVFVPRSLNMYDNYELGRNGADITVHFNGEVETKACSESITNHFRIDLNRINGKLQHFY